MLYINPANVHSLPRKLAFAIREHVAERVHVQRRLQRAGWRPVRLGAEDVVHDARGDHDSGAYHYFDDSGAHYHHDNSRAHYKLDDFTR